MTPWIWLLLLPFLVIQMIVAWKLLSLVDQWDAFVRAYLSPRDVPRKMLRWQSALVDGMRYRSCLLVGWDCDGMYMVPEKIFRWRKPPVFVTWAEFTLLKVDYWTWYPYRLHLRRLPNFDLRIRPSLARKLTEGKERVHKVQ